VWLHEDDELPVLQTKQVDLKKTNNSYRLNGAKKLFSKLPSTVKFFSLETSMFKDIAVTMDNSDIEPKVLDFMVVDKNDEITRSEVFTTEQDLLFIKRQTVLEKLKVEMSVETLENAGVVCECLKEFHMSIKGKQDDQVQLGLILDAFPSLEILKIEATSALELIGGKTEGKSFPKLREVNIKFDSTQADLPQIMCTIAPNLKKLSWTIAEELDRNGKRTVNKTPTKKRVPGKSMA
jgi:hypothetical protein